MTKSTTNVTHVIFDVDGTLLDTEIYYSMANQAILNRFGREFTPEMQAQMMGKNGQSANEWLLKEVGHFSFSRSFLLYCYLKVGISDQISPEDFGSAKDAILAKMFPQCQALPGAERLVRHLAKKHVPMAICSGSCMRKFMLKSVKHRDWLDLIPIQVIVVGS
ncbi:unnamed protein product [Heligmosomoides polygyrus]|uniref:HAD family hydrolase n=1 Tax=Heligmosomoides polygyrus TaxID=6339 RepID=A0A183GRI4_HELPZ|nr:unnamed protein product [Heligmosomoides polygyrus]